MSSLSDFIDCPNLQTNLNGFFGENPQLLVEAVPLSNFLASDMNRVGDMSVKLSNQVNQGNGKLRTVELTYTPRFLESDVDVGTGRTDCTSTNLVGETSQLYTIEETDYVQYDFLVDYWELKRRCEENSTYFMRVLQQAIDVVTRKRETDLYTELAAMPGNFSVGEPGVTNDVKAIPTAYANGTLDPTGMAEIVTATRYAGYATGPVIFGGRAMGIYFNKINAGCCSIDGVDIDRLHSQYGYAYLESYRADDVFGVDNFVTVAPGAVQLLDWSEYEGTANNFNMIDTPLLQQRTIIDPRTGIKYDYKAVVDCNGKVSVFIRSWFKLVSLPADAFFVGDRLEGVNWINEFTIDNP